MKQKDFEKQAREAAKAMQKKKAPTQPVTQFLKGALWAWNLLMTAKTAIYYEEVLRKDVCNRYDIHEPERWQELLISETAAMMADRDGMQADILKEGRLIEKMDKNMNTYKESNPLYVHLKELQRSIGMQREHLGLSAKSAKKMESSKRGGEEHDKLQSLLNDINQIE